MAGSIFECDGASGFACHSAVLRLNCSEVRLLTGTASSKDPSGLKVLL
jgi:hypothetical protein